MLTKLMMMIWYLFSLLKEGLWNTWTSFSKNIDKNYQKIRENILNAQGLLVIHPGKQLLLQIKDTVMNQILHPELKNFKLMIITKNIFKIIKRRCEIQAVLQVLCKMN